MVLFGQQLLGFKIEYNLIIPLIYKSTFVLLSSTPEQTYSSLFETKDFLNIARSNTDSDQKINSARNAADNYVGNQIRLHAALPIPANANPELTSMATTTTGT